MADGSPDVRTVLRIRREMMLLNLCVQFRHSQDEMFFRVGRIQGQLEATLSTSLTDREIKLRANSMFLLECLQEVTAPLNKNSSHIVTEKVEELGDESRSESATGR
jgi:hypothetical protein